MKILLSVIVVIVLFSTLMAQPRQKDLDKVPSKIEKIMIENHDLDPEAGRHFYIAYGIAVDKHGKKYNWYSFINSDYYYQFRFDANLNKKDSVAISQLMDGMKRPYDSFENWIGASNDWIFSEYSTSTCYKKYTGKYYIDYNGKKQPEYDEVSSLCAATIKYVKMMQKIFKKFEVAAVNQELIDAEYAWALK